MRHIISKYFPNAEPAALITGDYLKLVVEGYHFDLEKTLFATSICSDDINISAEFRNIYERPFVMGGLAGLPFTGLTGMTAFAHHVPDNGFAFIFFGPHIGINQKSETGKILRYGQHKNTSCCGAIDLAIKSILGKIPSIGKEEGNREFDYQEYYLLDYLTERQGEIEKAEDPIIKATDLVYEKISSSIRQLVEEKGEEFDCKKIALLGGIIINTDHDLEDYVDIRDFVVLDFK